LARDNNVITFPFLAGTLTVDGRYFCTGSSSLTLPSLTILARAIEVNVFDIDPISNKLFDVVDCLLFLFIKPKFKYSTLLSSIIAIETPTAFFLAILCSTNCLIVSVSDEAKTRLLFIMINVQNPTAKPFNIVFITTS